MPKPVWFQSSTRPDEVDGATLTADHVERMIRSPYMRQVVRDTRLQKLLLEIDADPNALKRVQDERANNADFNEFSMNLLAIIHGIRLTGATDPDGIRPPSPLTLLKRMLQPQ